MRFIKKASIENLNEVASIYKEIELYTTRGDFSDGRKINDSISKIKEVYNNNKAVITAIHCPPSIWKTSIDKDTSTNYMSWCEVINNNEEKDLFLRICEFIREISGIYDNSNSKNELDQEDDDLTDDEYVNNSKTKKVKITLILHTGCIIGCTTKDDKENFTCIFNDSSKCFQNNLKIVDDKIGDLLEEIIKNQNIQIAFENITPFYDGTNIGNNSGYNYEGFILAKKLNEISQTSKFGVVIDFCHIFATNQLLNIKKTDIEYLDSYFGKITDSSKKLIMLFHLSNYKDNNHGESFNETREDQKKVNKIRELCYEYAPTAPITLEVVDSDSVKKGIDNFNNMMIEWSKLHILLDGKISTDLYNFFENLYYIYSNQYNKNNKNMILKNAFEIKDYVLSNSSFGNTLFDFNYDGQKLNINLFQVQSYIYYMRYCNLALDLVQKYENKFDITATLKHYIFNDQLEEIKFDGLGCYYNIYWIKNKATLFRCYDGIQPETNTFINFKEILKACFKHIYGNKLQFLSFSKTFGRIMLKYFDPNIYDTDINGKKYNVEIFKNAPINCFLTDDDKGVKQITLQEYQDIKKANYSNFSIDFSDFYNRRGDANKEASLKELYEKTSEEKWFAEKIGSVYDQEVIFYNYQLIETNKYFLSKEDFIIMIVAYQIVFDLNKNYKKFENNIDVCRIVDAVCNKKDDIFNYFNIILDKEINFNNIKDILKNVDFKYEIANSINFNNECYSDFTRSMKDYIKELNYNQWYNNLYNEVKKEKKSESSC